MADTGRQTAIKRQSLPETLSNLIRERILSGEFNEGDQLVQETLAAEYEVSRMPVREALRQLEAQGLVALRTHKGAVVTTVPMEQIGELFDLRAMLECDVLAKAVPAFKKEHIEAAEAILGQLETAYRRKDVGAWGKLNWDFHRSLYAPSNRVQTIAIIEGIYVQTDRFIRLSLAISGAVKQAEKEHRALLRLCKAGQTKEAVAFLRKHILDAGKIPLKKSS